MYNFRNNVHNYCKSCGKKRSIEWSRNNTDKRKSYVLKSATGVTDTQYQDLLKLQDYKCAICNKTIAENQKNLGVDHCHTTNIIRGLLCNNCNLGIGYFQDDINILRKTIEYLESPINKDEKFIFKGTIRMRNKNKDIKND